MISILAGPPGTIRLEESGSNNRCNRVRLTLPFGMRRDFLYDLNPPLYENPASKIPFRAESTCPTVTRKESGTTALHQIAKSGCPLSRSQKSDGNLQ